MATQGYPTKNGIYWVRTYSWNNATKKHDLVDYNWYCVEVLGSKFFYHGNENPEDTRHIYEYQEIGKI